MPIHEVETVAKPFKPKTDKFLPTVTQWKKTKMVRKHSFLAAVKEIIHWSEEIDVTRVGIIGDMHSGKSTMVESIAHAIHKNSNLPWTIKKLGEKELLDFEKSVKNLSGGSAFILIFDDVSFLDAKHNKKSIGMVKEAVTKIRHLDGGRDVKIILIYNYHYTMGLDKYLRQADFRFFTTVGSSETENMESIVGHKKMNLVKEFSKMRQQGITKKYFGIMLRNKKLFSYKWRDPFIPVLFYNNSTLRMIVSPTRQWMDSICSICSHADGIQSQISTEQFVKESSDKFTLPTFKAVVKQVLKEHGINTYSSKIVQARRYLDRALDKKIINLEQLALELDLKPTKTRLDKKLDGVLES